VTTQNQETDSQQAQQETQWLLELLSSRSSTSVTAELLGQTTLHERMPDAFGELAQQYGALLDRALEERVYKVEHRISDCLRNLAAELGLLKAGPRDVVELHMTVLEQPRAGIAPPKARARDDAARMLVLELMGCLVSYYRNYALGAWTSNLAKEQAQ